MVFGTGFFPWVFTKTQRGNLECLVQKIGCLSQWDVQPHFTSKNPFPTIISWLTFHVEQWSWSIMKCSIWTALWKVLKSRIFCLKTKLFPEFSSIMLSESMKKKPIWVFTSNDDTNLVLTTVHAWNAYTNLRLKVWRTSVSTLKWNAAIGVAFKRFV